MLKAKRKYRIGLGLVSAILILTSSFVVTKALVPDNTYLNIQSNSESIKSEPNNISKPLSNESEVNQLDNGLKTEYMGTLDNMPSHLKTPCVEQAFSDGNWTIKVTSGYKSYTYESAPEEVKSQYEADCKSINKTPNPSDIISVPQK